MGTAAPLGRFGCVYSMAQKQTALKDRGHGARRPPSNARGLEARGPHAPLRQSSFQLRTQTPQQAPGHQGTRRQEGDGGAHKLQALRWLSTQQSPWRSLQCCIHLTPTQPRPALRGHGLPISAPAESPEQHSTCCPGRSPLRGRRSPVSAGSWPGDGVDLSLRPEGRPPPWLQAGLDPPEGQYRAGPGSGTSGGPTEH